MARTKDISTVLEEMCDLYQITENHKLKSNKMKHKRLLSKGTTLESYQKPAALVIKQCLDNLYQLSTVHNYDVVLLTRKNSGSSKNLSCWASPGVGDKFLSDTVGMQVMKNWALWSNREKYVKDKKSRSDMTDYSSTEETETTSRVLSSKHTPKINASQNSSNLPLLTKGNGGIPGKQGIKRTLFDTCVENEEIYEVEEILEKRCTLTGQIEYLVKWRDWPDSFNSWEPEKNILDKKLLSNFDSDSSSCSTCSSDVFKVESVLRKRTKVDGTDEYLVKWVDWDDEHNSWEPEDNFIDKTLLSCFN